MKRSSLTGERFSLRQLGLVTVMVMAGLLTCAGSSSASQAADQDLQEQVDRLERRMDSNEEKAAKSGAVLFLIGCVCALWAQNSGRSAWLWFFMGLFFNVFALVAMLMKNARDLAAVAGESDLE